MKRHFRHLIRYPRIGPSCAGIVAQKSKHLTNKIPLPQIKK